MIWFTNNNQNVGYHWAQDSKNLDQVLACHMSFYLDDLNIF